ncbi:hypothetical protein [Subtercola sp. RTI3]|uniref:hypothetical protein n=1 Tax=Subtercola sp. RTI3 TaxID=3048639 RepID=UPI002B23A6A1|nr:hypothetical protein [Subtercola sp. RTI3]MEA9985662.1 hypothetical protein [Subtercola sp. RTI3]
MSERAELVQWVKTTTSGNKFHVRFFDDGSLIEWAYGADESVGWGGTWVSGAVKNDYVATVIGGHHTHYVPFLPGELSGAEKVNDEVVGESTLSSPTLSGEAVDANAMMHRMQGYS